jgi:hypothetical protein
MRVPVLLDIGRPALFLSWPLGTHVRAANWALVRPPQECGSVTPPRSWAFCSMSADSEDGKCAF